MSDGALVLAVTTGDPLGIGPEVVAKTIARGDGPARLLVLGDARSLARDGAGGPALPIVDGPEGLRRSGAPAGMDRASDDLARRLHPDPLPPHGQATAWAGEASHAWVLRGADLALAGDVDALVTGPIHKEAWHAAGVASPGHTEALAQRAGAARVVMMLAGERLRVALATIHVALARVPGLLSAEGIEADLAILDRDLRGRFGVASPRIGVCGLNPHAGEGGLFGREDRDVIAPAVEAARRRGIDASGPWPADACLPQAAAGRYDAALAMYHDQGLPVVKALSPRTAVNVTLGLPFVRTSVDHGTAFDVAGRGVADAGSLGAAIELAATLARRARRE